MKTIVNRISTVIAGDVTILHDTKTNKLMEVSYVKTIIGLDGSVTHVFTNNKKEYRVPQPSNNFRMYESREQFARGNSIGSTSIYLDAARTHGRFKFNCEENRETADLVSVSFVNGLPAEVEAPVSGFEAYIENHYSRIDTIYEDGVDLSEYFDSVQRATDFHDFTLINNEGKEETVEGRCSFIMPTKEQKPVVEELRAVLNKMREVGLALMLDTSYGNLHVYNANAAYIEYDGGDSGVTLYKLDMPESIELPNPIYDYNDDECYRIYRK